MQGISNLSGFTPLLASQKTGMNMSPNASDYGFRVVPAPTALAQLTARGGSLSISPSLDAQTVQTLLQNQELAVQQMRVATTPNSDEAVLPDSQRKKRRQAKSADPEDELLEDDESDDLLESEIPLPRNFVRSRRKGG